MTIIVTLILAICTVNFCSAKEKNDNWRFIHSRSFGEYKSIFYLDMKNLKRRDDLLSFSIYKELWQLPKNKIKKVEKGEEAFDFIIDKAFTEMEFATGKSKTECVIDCENATVLTLNKTYYQPDGKTVILDLYNNVLSINGTGEQMDESISPLRGWKPLSLYMDYQKIYDTHCRPKYQRKDLKIQVPID